MEAWEQFLKALEKTLGKETIEKWLRPLKVVDYDACNLYLEAKDSFQLIWFEEQMRKRVQKEFINNNHRPIRVHLTCASLAPVQKTVPKKDIPPVFVQFDPDPLDPHALLEKFIPGKNNEVVFKLLSNLAFGNEPLGGFNPIYLHGGSGTGKSHLLMALAAEFLKRNISTLYVRAETFTEHVVNAIRGGRMREFRNAYRLPQILLIDDVHLFARKSATQEELFHTFNTLHTSGRQIFLSGDKAPQLLKEIEARLISRFEWGIILTLEKLHVSELEAMIAKRCESLNFFIDDKTIQFLISTFQRNIKSLHQALEALVLRSHMKNIGTISLDIAQTLVSDLIQTKEAIALTPEKIVQKVAEHYTIRSSDILGKSQSHDCSLPRQVAMYLCRKELNLPFLKIAAFFGRDHSTVMTSVKQIQQKIDSNDRSIKFILADILKQFN